MRCWRVFVALILANSVVWGTTEKDDNKGEAPTFGIKIEEKHIRVMRALADMLFSYNERNGDSEELNLQPKQPKSVKKKDTSPENELALNSTDSKSMLRVGVVDDCLPFCSQRGGEFVGFEVDLVRLLAQEGNFDCQFVAIPRKNIRAQLAQKKLDAVIGGNVVDKELTDQYSEGYLSVDLGVVYRKILFKKGFSLVNRSIGVVADSYGSDLLKNANIQGSSVVPYDDIHTLLLHVLGDEKSGCVDGALIDHRTAQDWIAQYPELTYRSLKESRELAFLVAPGTQWKTVIDQGLKEVMKSQKFRELLERWSFGKI